MSDIERQARELLAAVMEGKGWAAGMAALLVRERPDEVRITGSEAIQALIAALTPPEGCVLVPAEVSGTTRRLIDLLIERDKAGRAKYGATLDRTDLARNQWLQHMVEELLDGAGYALAAQRPETKP